MTTLNESIRYPTNREDWYKTIIIGGILSIFGFLVIPILLVYGYIYRLIRTRLAGEQQPPEFGDWATLLVDGIKVLIVGIIYFLIPLIVAGATVGGAVMGMATGTEIGAAVGIVGLFGGLLLTFVLTLVFGYVAVAGLVNFARTEQLADAFDFATIRPVLFHGDYAMGWLMAIVVLIVAGIIGGALNIIPLIGFIIAAFVYFYAQMVAASLWADGFNASTATSDVGQPVSEDLTA